MSIRPIRRAVACSGQARYRLLMPGLGRYGQVDEVAALVAFVASSEASDITGANLTVDGGTNA